MTDTLTTYDIRDAWRGCTPATPYQRGFEDCRYARFYANPYAPGSPAWHAYDAGSRDANHYSTGPVSLPAPYPK